MAMCRHLQSIEPHSRLFIPAYLLPPSRRGQHRSETPDPASPPHCPAGARLPTARQPRAASSSSSSSSSASGRFTAPGSGRPRRRAARPFLGRSTSRLVAGVMSPSRPGLAHSPAGTGRRRGTPRAAGFPLTISTQDASRVTEKVDGETETTGRCRGARAAEERRTQRQRAERPHTASRAEGMTRRRRRRRPPAAGGARPTGARRESMPARGALASRGRPYRLPAFNR